MDMDEAKHIICVSNQLRQVNLFVCVLGLDGMPSGREI
jgi:hypothetical protein